MSVLAPVLAAVAVPVPVLAAVAMAVPVLVPLSVAVLVSAADGTLGVKRSPPGCRECGIGSDVTPEAALRGRHPIKEKS